MVMHDEGKFESSVYFAMTIQNLGYFSTFPKNDK